MRFSVLATLALLGGFSPLAGAEEPTVLKVRPTQAELATRVAARGKSMEGRKELTPLDPESIKKKERQEIGGLLERSTFLSLGDYWTLVPKGSVLHVPSAFASRVSTQPPGTGRLLPWGDFLARNRGWIHPQTVAITDARGESSLSEEILETHRTIGRVVVAVLHNGPISVKAPLPEEAEKENEDNAPESKPQPLQKR